jgi:AcrR family transcriptional regulator
MGRMEKRAAYRHGNLRAALLEAGLDLARDAGPAAVVLREATRRAGVVPNAAYRHFADREALLTAVRQEALAHLGAAMLAGLAATPFDRTPAAARARLRAVGAAYLAFARVETGLFLTAFSGSESPAEGERVKEGSTDPFALLSATMDDLVATGAMVPERRVGAEFSAWSSVHGLAMLMVAGPLREAPDEQTASLAANLLDMVERGLAGG